MFRTSSKWSSITTINPMKILCCGNLLLGRLVFGEAGVQRGWSWKCFCYFQNALYGKDQIRNGASNFAPFYVFIKPWYENNTSFVLIKLFFHKEFFLCIFKVYFKKKCSALCYVEKFLFYKNCSLLLGKFIFHTNVIWKESIIFLKR